MVTKLRTVSTFPPQLRTVSTFPPQLRTVSTFPPQLRTVSTFPPQLRTVSTFPPQQRTVSTFPPHQRTVSTFPPQLRAVSTFLPQQRTVSTFPPQNAVRLKIHFSVLALVVCIIPVQALPSSTMGDYFVAYLPRLPAGSTAQAHVISPFIECTKVTQTVTYVIPANVTTQRVIQTWAAIFDIPVDVIPTQTGISGAFVYRGNGKFSLDVYIDVKGQQGTAYIPVVPVEGFGRRYLVHTFNEHPVLVIVAGPDMTTVTVTSPNIQNIRNADDQDTKDGDTFTFSLKREQAFVSGRCDTAQDVVGSLSGSVVSSDKPVGVLVGNCRTRGQDERTCSTSRTNIVLDMTVPDVTYGKKFLIPHVKVPGSNPYIIIQSSTDNTFIEFTVSHFQNTTTSTIGLAGHTLMMEVHGPHVVVADKPVVCYLVVQGSCGQTNVGVARTLVVPTILFYNIYTWNSMPTGVRQHKVYLTLIVYTMDVTFVYVESLNIRLQIWQTFMGDRAWRTTSLEIEADTSYAHLHGRLHGFGCYLYSFDDDMTYIQTRGLILTDFTTNYCDESTRVIRQSDLIDNDCDGSIDEELLNNQDDDNDGLIDEDVVDDLFVDGHWSEWGEWECDGSCGTSTFISYRSCNNPKPRYMGKTCKGYFVRKNNSSCKGLVECGQNCTRRRYGYQCAFTCDNCVSNCHPVNGSCAECLPGWRDPRLACNTPCPEWTYGFRCEMMCEKKCGADCVSRVDGACPESNMMFISSVWTVLLLGLITLAFIALWYNEATRLTLLLMVSAIKGKNYIWRYKNKKWEKILVLTTPNLYKKLTSTKKKKGRKGKKSTRVFLSEVDGQTIRTGKKSSKKKKKAKVSAKRDTGKESRKKKLSAKKLAKKRARKLAKKKRKQLQQAAGSSTQVDGKDAADVTPSMWSEIASYVKESIKYNSLASTPNHPSPKSVSEVPSTNVSGGKDTDTKMAAQIKPKSSSTNASATKGSKSPESPKNIFEPPSPNIVSTRRKSEPPSLKIHSPKSKSEPPSPKIPSPKTKSQPPSPKIDSP